LGSLGGDGFRRDVFDENDLAAQAAGGREPSKGSGVQILRYGGDHARAGRTSLPSIEHGKRLEPDILDAVRAELSGGPVGGAGIGGGAGEARTEGMGEEWQSLHGGRGE